MKNTTINCTIVHVLITCILLSLIVSTSGCILSSPANDSVNHYPDAANGSPRFTAIAAYGPTGLALRTDGKIVCWGRNSDDVHNGLCDIPYNLTNVASIAPMNYAIKNDGTVAGWGGSDMNPVFVSNVTGVIALTRIGWCNLALKDDGTVVLLPQSHAWECDNETQRAIIENRSGLTSIAGKLGLKKSGTVITLTDEENVQSSYLQNLSDVIAVSNYGENYVVLKKDGTVKAWKVPRQGEVNEGRVLPTPIVKDLKDIRAVSAGYGHNLALRNDGTVVFWTDESIRSLDLTDIAAISAGSVLDLALKKDGTIVAWGDNKYGQLFTPGNTNNIKSISSGYGPNIILKNDGTIVTWGYIEYMQGHEPEGIRNVTGVLADYQRYLILMNNNTIYGWGNPESGPFRVNPIAHPYLTLFSGNITTGHKVYNFLYALNKNGNLVVLSHNALISGRLDNITEISSNGGSCILGVKSDGTVTAWEYNGAERTDIPKNLSFVVAVSAGLQHYLAVKKDGTVIAWGENALGQTDIPEGLFDVTAVSAGVFHSLALKKDGTVVCWGGNKNGECNIPENLHDVVEISAGYGQSLALKKDGTIVAWGKTVIPDWFG
jgi:alpha-tubulin suppressor-like RCC1 family protein